VLYGNGNLYEYSSAFASGWTLNATSVSQIAAGNYGSHVNDVFVLYGNGYLYEYGAVFTSGWSLNATGVRQIAAGNYGSHVNDVFVLYGNGNLYEYGGAISGGWQLIDQLVASSYTDTSRQLKVTYTPISQKWHDLGGATGSLGLPGGGVNQGDGFQWQDFQYGVIYYSSGTGAHAILGNPTDRSTFWGAFAASDYQRGLGLPVSDAVIQNGRLVQLFQKGALGQGADGHVWTFLPPPPTVAQVGVVAVDLSGNVDYLVVPDVSALVPSVNDPIIAAQVGVVAVTGAGETESYGGTIIISGSSSSPTNAGDVLSAIAEAIRSTYHSDQSGAGGQFLSNIASLF
jgi:hypothetical protein